MAGKGGRPLPLYRPTHIPTIPAALPVAGAFAAAPGEVGPGGAALLAQHLAAAQQRHAGVAALALHGEGIEKVRYFAHWPHPAALPGLPKTCKSPWHSPEAFSSFKASQTRGSRHEPGLALKQLLLPLENAHSRG